MQLKPLRWILDEEFNPLAALLFLFAFPFLLVVVIVRMLGSALSGRCVRQNKKGRFH